MENTLGIFFRSEDENLHLIHLGWHDRLKCQDPDELYCWVPCEYIEPVILANIADWLSIVWEVNGQKIPYSIKQFDADPFDENGKLVKCQPGDGFTCATFVMWVFHHAYIDLFDHNSWEFRSDDEIWQKDIVARLENFLPNNTAHIEAQRDHIARASRYRPEEVAGASAIFNMTPIAFKSAERLGSYVVLQMDQKGML